MRARILTLSLFNIFSLLMVGQSVRPAALFTMLVWVYAHYPGQAGKCDTLVGPGMQERGAREHVYVEAVQPNYVTQRVRPADRISLNALITQGFYIGCPQRVRSLVYRRMC